jgi:hypothetical protein
MTTTVPTTEPDQSRSPVSRRQRRHPDPRRLNPPTSPENPVSAVYPTLEMYPPGEKRSKGHMLRALPTPADLDETAWGICLSGGGIRSAAFALGAIQEMHQHDMICGDQKATYLAAVSGGGYLAGALTALAGDPNGVKAELDPGGKGLRPFEAGSPEERYLRDKAQYLSHGRGGPWAAVATYLLGVTLNLLVVFGALYVVGRAVGWFYGEFFPQFRRNFNETTCHVTRAACPILHVATPLPDWAFPVIGAMAAAAFAAGLLWASDARSLRARKLGPWLVRAACALVALAALLAVALTAIPHLLEFLRVDLPRLGVGKPPTGSSKTVSAKASQQAGTTLTWGALAALAGTLVTGLSGILSSARTVDKNLDAQATSLFKRFRGRLSRPLLRAAEWVTVPLLATFVVLAAIVWGAGMPPWRPGANFWLDGVAWWLAPLVIVAALWRWGNITAWSPHSFYRDRLGAAFNLEWRAADKSESSPTAVAYGSGCLDVAPRPDSPDIDTMQPSSTPKLLVCAAVNVTDYGATATGSRVSSFVLSSDWVGGPAVGAMPAHEYLARTSRRDRKLDLLTAVAISGGAVAPEMGRMTRTSLEKLLTLANIRLGVWIPNPRRVADGATLATKGPNMGRYRFRATPHYLVKELFGWNRLNAKYVYVSDGGHYENLGLVELLRRHCHYVWCIDAAGDGPATFNTLGQALALAHSELGVTVEDFRPADTIAPDPVSNQARVATGKPPLAKDTVCVGHILYPDGTKGTLVYIKAAVTADSPWDIRAFQESHPTFPCDPTSNQLYTGDRVDAYRALGTWAVQQAWAKVGPDFTNFRRRISRKPGTLRVASASTALFASLSMRRNHRAR